MPVAGPDDAPLPPADAPVPDGLPPHAAVSSTSPAATANRPARRGRVWHQRQRLTPVWYMLPSSWVAGASGISGRLGGQPSESLITCLLGLGRVACKPTAASIQSGRHGRITRGG